METNSILHVPRSRKYYLVRVCSRLWYFVLCWHAYCILWVCIYHSCQPIKEHIRINIKECQYKINYSQYNTVQCFKRDGTLKMSYFAGFFWVLVRAPYRGGSNCLCSQYLNVLLRWWEQTQYPMRADTLSIDNEAQKSVLIVLMRLNTCSGCWNR